VAAHLVCGVWAAGLRGWAAGLRGQLAGRSCLCGDGGRQTFPRVMVWLAAVPGENR
jgi:hypothetical protein